jgi:hypothetical protein
MSCTGSGDLEGTVGQRHSFKRRSDGPCSRREDLVVEPLRKVHSPAEVPDLLAQWTARDFGVVTGSLILLLLSSASYPPMCFSGRLHSLCHLRTRGAPQNALPWARARDNDASGGLRTRHLPARRAAAGRSRRRRALLPGARLPLRSFRIPTRNTPVSGQRPPATLSVNRRLAG